MDTSTRDRFHVLDTTLRDGAQREGITFTVADKLDITRLLDAFGVGFVEGGWPGANPKDTEFFHRAFDEIDFRHARLTAFGATRRAGTHVEDDPQVRGLLDARTPAITIVAKSDVRHVRLALRTTPDENLAMVGDTVAYLREEGRRVFVDCEHFFDGYTADPEYAMAVVHTAHEAGADAVVLCDTNGGVLPTRAGSVVREVLRATGARIGIHAQDDIGCAVATTLASVESGATHVQCTANGYGERVGNADLFSVVATLELTYGFTVLPEGTLPTMAGLARAVAEIADLAPPGHRPYVGASAFAHKAGLHASAIRVDPSLYEHTDPERVGNVRRMLVSDMAGRASVELKSAELGYDLSDRPDVVARIVTRIKDDEARGWTYESAEASYFLLLREEARAAEGDNGPEFFQADSWSVVTVQDPEGGTRNQATVSLRVKGDRVRATGEGNGPVNALDRALRSALESTYPQLSFVGLVDYRVRILEDGQGTGATTRVLATFGDGTEKWSTVGAANDIVAASWKALHDAYTYGLVRGRA